METKKIIALLLILTFAFGGLLAFGSLFFQISQVRADTPTTATSSSNVTNVIPVASSVSIDSDAASVTLTENTTKTVTVTATITDNNGCEDIDSVSVKFYRTDLGAVGADDENHRYTVAATSLSTCTAGGGDLTDTYTAAISVDYYADPTDAGSAGSSTNWTAQVTPSDESAGTAATDTIEMATLTALDVTTTIAYGELALNADTGTGDTTTTITNTGNERIDVQVDGYGTTDGDGRSMTCTWGTTTIGLEKYATSTGVAYASRNSLTDTAVEVDMDIAQRTGAVSTGDFYWGFGLPVTGVGGNCTGKVVFTAYADPDGD